MSWLSSNLEVELSGLRVSLTEYLVQQLGIQLDET